MGQEGIQHRSVFHKCPTKALRSSLNLVTHKVTEKWQQNKNKGDHHKVLISMIAIIRSHGLQDSMS